LETEGKICKGKSKEPRRRLLEIGWNLKKARVLGLESRGKRVSMKNKGGVPGGRKSNDSVRGARIEKSKVLPQ